MALESKNDEKLNVRGRPRLRVKRRRTGDSGCCLKKKKKEEELRRKKNDIKLTHKMDVHFSLRALCASRIGIFVCVCVCEIHIADLSAEV